MLAEVPERTKPKNKAAVPAPIIPTVDIADFLNDDGEESDMQQAVQLSKFIPKKQDKQIVVSDDEEMDEDDEAAGDEQQYQEQWPSVEPLGDYKVPAGLELIGQPKPEALIRQEQFSFGGQQQPGASEAQQYQMSNMQPQPPKQQSGMKMEQQDEYRTPEKKEENKLP